MHSHEQHNCGGQDHSHDAGHVHIHPVTGNLKVAFALNLSFTIIEIIGGFFTNSVAILSDAVHDLGDSIAIGASLWMEKYSQKGRSTSFSYGYKRFSPLAAFISSLILVIGSVFIISSAIPRLADPQPVHANGMIWLAVLGVFFNGLAVLKLGRSGNSLNQKAVMLHLLEDALGWIAVLAGSVIMYYTEWYWIDPLLSLAIAALILYNAIRNLIATLKLFMQSVPAGVDQERIIGQLSVLGGIKAVHDLHAWSLDGSYNVASVHLVIDEVTTAEDQKKLRHDAVHVLQHNNVHHATVQLEYENEHCGLQEC
ncbi:MAG TPA: cation diffusion facilitator family transporter [Sphingobacteriaceae bacterium]